LKYEGTYIGGAAVSLFTVLIDFAGKILNTENAEVTEKEEMRDRKPKWNAPSRFASYNSRRLPSGRAHFLELGGGALGFIRARVQANYRAQFANGGGLLAKLRQAEAFSHPRRSRLETLRIVFNHFVVGVERHLILILHERDFAKIKLRVGSQVRVAVILHVVLKFLRGEIVVLAVDVPQGV